MSLKLEEKYLRGAPFLKNTKRLTMNPELNTAENSVSVPLQSPHESRCEGVRLGGRRAAILKSKYELGAVL